jgi:hypothetical protein
MKTLLLILALGTITVSAEAAKPLTTTYDFRAVDERGTQAYNEGLANPIGVSLPTRVIKAGYACVRLPLYRNEDGFVYTGFSCSDGKTTDGVVLACRDDAVASQTKNWVYQVPNEGYAISFTVSCSTK